MAFFDLLDKIIFGAAVLIWLICYAYKQMTK